MRLNNALIVLLLGISQLSATEQRIDTSGIYALSKQGAVVTRAAFDIGSKGIKVTVADVNVDTQKMKPYTIPMN